MKTTATILTCTILTCAALAAESRVDRATPQERPRLDPDLRTASAAANEGPRSGEVSQVVALSPYVVREANASVDPSKLVGIPQGAPAPSDAPILNMLQTGVLAERTGKVFKTEILAHGEPGPSGFGRIALGCRLSW